ncbi:acetyl-CoA acetyltransferase family protein [Bradyrhizobium sp. USDA 3686]
MPEAFIYDHVRTPRGRGKADGALHEVTALALATVPLKALKDRNNLPEDSVDDVILGVVDPVGEAGSDIARFAALKAGLGEAVPGVQISRFCASGLDAVNFAAAQVMSGQHELVIGGGAESMSRVGIGASGGAWPMDPSMAVPAYFMPQGVSADLIATKYGFSRDDVDAYAVQSQQRAAKSWEEGRFDKSVVPVKDINGLTILAKDEHMRPSTTMQSLGAAAAGVHDDGADGRLRWRRGAVASGNRTRQLRAPRRQFVGHCRWCRRRFARQQGSRRQVRTEAACKDPRIRQYRLGARDDADRPG